jgi:hypothetical protein
MTLLRSQWDRALAVAAAIAGAVVLIVGYVGVSNSGYSAEQLPYLISGGIGGIFLLGLAAVLWLSADLRDEWRLLDEIRTAIEATNAATTAGTPGAGVSNGASAQPKAATAAEARPVRQRRSAKST